MRKIQIAFVGKTKEPWLQEALRTYEKRLQGHIFLEWKDFVSQDLLENYIMEHSPILLDPSGTLFSSEILSQHLCHLWGARILLAIGGAIGFSPKAKAKASRLWSLSPLTFPHQIVKLLVVEQIYRALDIEKGGAYHK